jgi:hypothetical protein
MQNDKTTTVLIPFALWGGKKIFNYKGDREPFIGVAKDKLITASTINLQLGFLKTRPMYQEVETKPFIELSESQGWVNKVKQREINYLPMSELRKLTKHIKE